MRIQIIAVLCTFLFIGAFGKNARIIGGKAAKIRDFPFLVSIRFHINNIHLCGGVIISQKHVLTVAHCVQDSLSNWSSLKVFAGSSSLSAVEGTAYAVEDVKFHPNYNVILTAEDHYRNDLAIVFVIGFIQFSELQQAIPLPTADCTIGDKVTIVGWGLASVRRGVPIFSLRKDKSSILPREHCNQVFNFALYDEQICTYLKAFNSEVGDDGGPVISNGKLVGIISLRSTLFNDNYNVHSNVYQQLDFIRSVL
ncbi:PREDICTED: trypsin beta-like [Ceratosolen solmsi marchali]|uniref:Trypsin beta-like n=1 Tax=Ceratosolen solmsi marchali TaxID=326594 RepID=A0AAJ6YUA0_9HYME|nr:PREDICTED: trypsin beta-like [Ceratosolen solmsi marchali]